MRSKPTDQALVVNLLVCRLKLGIKVNQTTKLLLRMLRPKVVKTASWVQHKIAPATVDMDELIVDLESTTIEYITEHYEMGEVAWPLHYLFGYPSGVVRGWAMNYANKIRRHNATHSNYGLASVDDERLDFETRINNLNARVSTGPARGYEPDFDEALDADTKRLPIDLALTAVDDGVTLSLSEFRVLRFCLSNADPHHARSPVDGLHAWLAAHARVKRKTVSKYFRLASYRAIEAAGQTTAALSARGLDTRATVNTARRQRWLHGDTQTADKLTHGEVTGLLHDAGRADVTLHDVCWAYGVSDKAYYKLRDKHDGMTLEEEVGT